MKKQLSTGGFRFVLSLFVVCLAVGVFIKYSQTASSQRNELPTQLNEDNSPVATNGTVTTYPNGVITGEPEAFGVTRALRNLPKTRAKRVIKGEDKIRNEDGIFVDADEADDNQFLNGGTFNGAGAFAFDRAKMLAGDPSATRIPLSPRKFSSSV
ncbi:MAG: hypothetical protein ABIP78_05580 [Pyrinomonadaceae bacterium]